MPRAFACVRCGHACELDALVLRPAPGVPDDATERFIVAWEDRNAGGRLRRFWRTALDGAVHPRALGLAAASGADPWAAFWFLSRVSAWVVVPTSAIVAAWWAWDRVTSSARTGRGLGALAALGWDVAAWAGVTVGVMATIMLAAAVTSGTAKIALRVLGERVPWRVLWTINAYTSGPLLIAAVPCLGPYCAGWIVWVWCAVCAIIALTFGVPVPAWKSVVALFAAPAIVAAVLSVAEYFGLKQVAAAVAAPASMPVPADGSAPIDAPAPGEEPVEP
ncbi:MAG: Yip1 family protein [Phycisphaerales bacterium]